MNGPDLPSRLPGTFPADETAALVSSDLKFYSGERQVSNDAIWRNVEFLKRHQPEVEALWQKGSALEERLAHQTAAAPPKP
jgi:hypothetical protein